jgi:hypothetical protein
MPWFRVDDTFAMHDKTIAAGNAAIGLWTRAGSWSMQQLTDGFVPDAVLKTLGTPKERRKLVEVSLWDECEGGVRFRNWDECQPTKSQVETARQAAKERQRNARERAKSQRESQGESQRDIGVSHGPPNPTQPNKEEAKASSMPRKRGQRLPEDWVPAPAVRAQLTEQYPWIDLRAEHAKFTDFWKAKAGKDAAKLDWDATFRNWIRSAAERRPRPAARDAGDSDDLFAQLGRTQAQVGRTA